MDFQRLFSLHRLAVEEIRRKNWRKRQTYEEVVNEKGRHYVGISGPRGVGKSTLLRQLAAERPDAFYLSFETETIDDLFGLLRTLTESYGIRLALLDEVHLHRGFDRTLQSCFELLPDLRIVFTSSVSLVLSRLSADLSRRIRLVPMPPFTYREYLLFREGTDLPPIPLEDLVSATYPKEHLRHGHRFSDYLRGGVMPFALEEPEPLPLLRNILERVIGHDIPAVEPDLRVEETSLIRKTVEFIGRSAIDGISYSSLSRNLGVTKYKAERYVQLLEKSHILSVVQPHGTNVLREPKILLRLPYRLLFRPYEEALGGLSEDFFVEAARAAGLRLSYLKSSRGAKTPDYLVETAEGAVVVEIGGAGKGRSQFKDFKAERKLILSRTDIPHHPKHPLFLAGFLEKEKGVRP